MKKLIKIITIMLGLFIFGNISNAAYNLQIQNISLSNGQGNTISKGGYPDIDIIVENNGTDIFDAANLAAGFLSCRYKGNVVGNSRAISRLIINAGTIVKIPVSLNPLLTATSRTISSNDLICSITGSSTTFGFNLSVSEGGSYSSAIDESVTSIRNHLDAAEPNSLEGGGVTIKNFIFNIISNILIPIIILAGVVVGILGGYEIITSDKSDKLKSGILKIVFGVLGIIIILSAKYIGSVIFDIFLDGNATDIDTVSIASTLYEKIAYPFIKMAIYLVLGILFLILVGKSISIITSGDIKKAGGIVAWAAISILAIIGSKQIVEAVYGKQDEVLNYNATNLGQYGSGLFADKNIPLIYDIINRVLGITSIVILVIIIVQALRILLKPDKADNWKTLGKSLLYIFIGIMITGAGYLISNLLVIN